MRIRYWSLLLLLFLMTSCQAAPATEENTPLPLASPTLPQPGVDSFQAPDVEAAARAYLDAWEAEDYPAMYAMLTALSKDAIDEEQFTTRYRETAAEAAMSTVEAHVLSSLTQSRSAQVSYRVILHSVLVGDIQRDTTMNLTLEDQDWRVQWDDALILPELSGGNSLRMDYKIPSRSNIYDIHGSALVAQADATAIGLFPDQIDEDQADRLYTEIFNLTGIHPDTLDAMLEDFPSGAGWYLPLRAVPADQVQQRINVLSGLSGLVMEPFRSRFYFDGGIAPHVVGYVSTIQAEQAEEYRRRGYRVDERVGQMGLEEWGEEYLSGVRGGDLYVVDPEGLVVTKLAESSTEPAQSITTTIDKDLQLGVQQALDGFLGAAVVLEVDTGRVLALASSPGFDPNMFEPTNLNSQPQIEALFDTNTIPLLNRATQGQYPLGSVFKIITLSAALESGLYTPESIYECGYTFDELEGLTLYDWTWDHFQQDGRTQPSGTLTLPEGLMRSCNPYFWHIGLDLYNQGMTTEISDLAQGFGLGSPTGFELFEEEGQIPVPGNPVDATNFAIGQGNTQVTPLQVAEFIAAIGNGGTLYTPQVIESIAPPGGEPTLVFEPQARGQLPVSQETLQVVQDAMVSVIENRRGTAWHVFPNFPYPIAGKTGTAQDPPRDPHAWFAGYTFANREDKPDIAVVVVVENIGEGSDYAAPIFKGIVQQYFSGQRNAFPWESQPGLWKTPTPDVTETPESEE